MKAKHDHPSVNGFDVSPETLAHDLTMLRMYKEDLTIPENSEEFYDLYIRYLTPIRLEIESRTRHDVFNAEA